MKILKRIVVAIFVLVSTIVVIFTIGVLWPQATLQPVRTERPVAIVNVNVIDVVSGTVVPNHTVLIEKGLIRAVSSGAGVPAGARQIDGRGKYLLPAFWDMHTHVFAVSPLDVPPRFVPADM
ncbi:MAG TPA: hypothetical protein VEK79_03900 [Thermoanaerobaculia bacterium]|nr:hypothetical protein [Thermoanaerobaculia bacterium]